uniref:Uncharacterized protein n=1 Tax=Ammonifex degensii TaxID=42838 RepID=A0A7C1J515_9THEO
MYLVTWIEGEEVEYRLLPSQEELSRELQEEEKAIEEKNAIVVEIKYGFEKLNFSGTSPV